MKAPGSLYMDNGTIARLFAHAFEQSPNECCGLLLGRNSRVSKVTQIKNVAASATERYRMDITEMSRAIRNSDNMQLLAIYHSHPHTVAYPSSIDIESSIRTGWNECLQVVISLAEPHRPVIRAFKIGDDSECREYAIITG